MKTVSYYFTPASPWTYLGHARFVEMVARQVGRCIIKQLAEEEAALRRSYQPAVQMLPSADLAVGRRAQAAGHRHGADPSAQAAAAG